MMKSATHEFLLNTIKQIVASQKFYESLVEINENFFNLKQESHIRNALLIQLNEYFFKNNLDYKTLSEYPRINNTRVDLSIVNTLSFDEVFKVELKFQLVGDYKEKSLIYRKNEIQYDFKEKKSDLFILTVIEWNDAEKLIFDKKYGLVKSLTDYNKGNSDKWEGAIKSLFNTFTASKFYEHEKIEILKPYKTAYRFYFLSKGNEESQ